MPPSRWLGSASSPYPFPRQFGVGVARQLCGSAYLRALSDIGQQYDPTDAANSPGLNFTVQIDNPGSYTVWARGMAPDAAGDSLHVGVNDGTPTTAANLTGFAPNTWTWSRLTMSSTNAIVDLTAAAPTR